MHAYQTQKKVSSLSFRHLIMMSFTQGRRSDQSHVKGSVPCNFKPLLTEDPRVHPGQLSPNWSWLFTIISLDWVVDLSLNCLAPLNLDLNKSAL